MRVGSSIYNTKLSRDKKILLPLELKFEENNDSLNVKNRILFTQTTAVFNI